MTEKKVDAIKLTEEKENKRLFKISAVGLDTTALNYPADLEPDEYEYVHINFNSNNDEFIKSIVRDTRYIFMTVDFIDGLYNSIVDYCGWNSLVCLKGLLINANCDFETYKGEIVRLQNSPYVAESGIGISQPETVEQLIKISKIIDFDYISLNICPLNFNAEVIKWAEQHNKKIIGFNPFGGHISSADLIDSFTVPYLLGVIATYADYVFLSSRDLVYAASDRIYLESLIGCEFEKLYLFTKSLNKLNPPIKKAIKNYLIVDGEIVIEVEDPCFTFSKGELIISISSLSAEEIPEPKLPGRYEYGPHKGDFIMDIESITPEEYINTQYITNFSINKPKDISETSYVSWLKYVIMNHLGTYNSEKYKSLNGSCEVTSNKICKNAIVINTFVSYIEKTGIFTVNKRAEESNYLLYFKNGKFLFRKISTKD